MPDRITALSEIVDAEFAAAEARIAAEKLRTIGAWFAYSAASELARVRQAKVDALKARSVGAVRRAMSGDASSRSLASL